MQICEAEINDAPEILKLQKAAYVSEAALHDDFTIPPLTQTLPELEAEFEHKTILKIVKDGKLLASGQVQKVADSAHIGRMAVWPELKGQGIGSQLLSALENVYPALRVELFTGINSLANLSMYERRGYRQFKQAKLGKTTVVYLEKRTA